MLSGMFIVIVYSPAFNVFVVSFVFIIPFVIVIVFSSPFIVIVAFISPFSCVLFVSVSVVSISVSVNTGIVFSGSVVCCILRFVIIIFWVIVPFTYFSVSGISIIVVYSPGSNVSVGIVVFSIPSFIVVVYVLLLILIVAGISPSNKLPSISFNVVSIVVFVNDVIVCVGSVIFCILIITL